MSMDGIASVTQAYSNQTTTKAKETKKETRNEHVGETETKESSTESSAAAVYEKSEPTAETEKKIYTRDNATVERMLQEAEKRTQALRDLILKMMLKQGQTYKDATDVYGALREGKLKVDPEVSENAKKDIAEDGYWGVEQTSDRLVSFAKALAGSDPSKANEMIEAVKKGYEKAAKAWGGNLPEICKKTLDTAISKLESWRDGKEGSSTEVGTSKKQVTTTN